MTLTPPDHYEIRADALIVRANLADRDRNRAERYTIIIDRIAEPQDANWRRIGEPIRLPSYSTPLSSIADREYTVDGVTLSVAEIAEFVARVVDDLKGEGLEQPSPAY